MKRRDFVKLACATPALLGFAPQVCAEPADTAGRWRTFRVIYQVNLPAEGIPARVWLPLPSTQDGYQQALRSEWMGDVDKGKFVALPSNAPAFYGEWQGGTAPREIKVISLVKTVDRSVDLSKAAKLRETTIPEEVRPFLQPTKHIPVNGLVHKTALSITHNLNTPLEKARAIYEWVVDNTFRNPQTEGCGRGDITFMLETGNLGGKCADISSLFVGLARASGIPAREVFGIRVADSSTFKSIGKSGDISKAQHCRAEFYLAGMGWIPVDPADVRKVVLEEKIPLNDPKVAALRQKLFGAWEMNWVALNSERDFYLKPDTAAGEMNFFMYPHGEIAGVPRESLDPPKFAYKITSEEI